MVIVLSDTFNTPKSRSITPSQGAGSTLLSTILSNLNLNDTNSQHKKHMTGPESIHDYEEILSEETDDDRDETTLITPKDQRKIPTIRNHISRWLKTQRRQNAPKKNLTRDFNKIAHSQSAPKSPRKNFQQIERRIYDMQLNADYHFQRYKSFVLHIHSEKKKLAEEKYKAKHRANSTRPSSSYKKLETDPKIRTGYFHPNALSNLQPHRNMRAAQRQERTKAWIRVQNPDYNKENIPRSKLGNVVPTQTILNNISALKRSLPTPAHSNMCHHQPAYDAVGEPCHFDANPPARTRQPLTISAALNFMKERNFDLQRSNSFVYNRF